MPNRLPHDAAFLLTRQLMGEIYHLARTAIEHYAKAEERKRRRLRPEESSAIPD